MLDLNEAEGQTEARGAIPPESIVLVRLNLRTPKAGKAQGSHALLTRASSGMEYLDCEFEVVSGTYTGRKMWNNMNLLGTISTDGQKKAVDITKRMLRAIMEATRGFRPDDASPAAVEARKLQSLDVLQGLMFGVKIGVEKPMDGDRYVNNNIKRIITPDHEFYATVMQGGEFISDKPVPEIPQAAGGPSPSWAAPGTQAPNAAPAAPAAPRQGNLTAPGAATFQAPASHQAPPVQQQYAPPAQHPYQHPYQQPPQGNGTPSPAWARNDLGPAFPSEASGMDDVPF
ncbi:MAG: hypothetical protein ACLGSA_12695 [Acidobacteriota bacterium]